MILDEYPVNVLLNTKLPIKNLEVGIYNPSHQRNIWVLVNGFPIFDDNAQ
jgi:hypothetical protein